MGCWNKTCGLSRLPILAGTPVYVFVLTERAYHDRCYSTAFWRPILAPFEAKYNEYGGGEDALGIWLPYIIEGLRSSLAEREQGENQYHDIPVTRADFDVDMFFDAVHENRLSAGTYMGKPIDVDFVMIRKDVADHMCDNLELEHYVGTGKGDRPDDAYNGYIHYKFKDVLVDVPALVDATIARLQDLSADEPAMAQLAPWRVRISDIFDYNHSNKAAWFMVHDTHRYSSIVDVNETIINTLHQDNNRQLAEELLREHIRAVFLDSVFDMCRVLWAPGGHEGSQSAEYYAYEALMSSIATAIAKDKSHWDE